MSFKIYWSGASLPEFKGVDPAIRDRIWRQVRFSSAVLPAFLLTSFVVAAAVIGLIFLLFPDLPNGNTQTPITFVAVMISLAVAQQVMFNRARPLIAKKLEAERSRGTPQR